MIPHIKMISSEEMVWRFARLTKVTFEEFKAAHEKVMGR